MAEQHRPETVDRKRDSRAEAGEKVALVRANGCRRERGCLIGRALLFVGRVRP